jgi:hypothetical protein
VIGRQSGAIFGFIRSRKRSLANAASGEYTRGITTRSSHHRTGRRRSTVSVVGKSVPNGRFSERRMGIQGRSMTIRRSLRGGWCSRVFKQGTEFLGKDASWAKPGCSTSPAGALVELGSTSKGDSPSRPKRGRPARRRSPCFWRSRTRNEEMLEQVGATVHLSRRTDSELQNERSGNCHGYFSLRVALEKISEHSRGDLVHILSRV